MNVIQVDKRQLLDWMRSTSIAKKPCNRFMNYWSSLSSESCYDAGCYVVAEMDVDVLDPDFYEFEYVNFFCSLAVAESYVQELMSRNEFTSYPVYCELWQITDYTIDCPRFADISVVEDYFVIPALGDFAFNFDVRGIASEIVDYDAFRQCFVLKPIYNEGGYFYSPDAWNSVLDRYCIPF